MKVFILAGGYGTRLSEFTSEIPKPAVVIGNKPMIFHILEIYSKQGFNEFVILLGYKSEILKRCFINYSLENSDLNIDLKDGSITKINESNSNWKVTLVDTGLHTLTGGRLLRAKEYIDGRFLMTYGDGLADIAMMRLFGGFPRECIGAYSEFLGIDLQCSQIQTRVSAYSVYHLMNHWLLFGRGYADESLRVIQSLVT